MIYHLLFPLAKYFSSFNVMRYITFRGGCAFVTSFFIVILLGNFIFKKLKRLKIVERIDMYGHVHLESLHKSKKGTPTMGGILVVFSIIVSTILWGRWDNFFIWISIIVMAALSILGLVDDLLKVKKGRGLSRSKKLFFQILIGAFLGVVIVLNKNLSTALDFPFFKKVIVDLGYFYIFWVILVVVCTTNAVNFTDGLDGLAIGALVINSLIFALFCYLAGHIKFANYLFIPYVEGAGELTIICLSLVGAGLGFLWFNSHPAQIFMGDVGALSLGGVIGTIALLTKKEFVLFISGGLFVIEAFSVILQILFIKLRGRKIFQAAPLHHHFQLLGWKESKIVIRFWIISIICAVIALLTLKLR
ncbi:MAG: phospho-N-acetylmuramoyl-pentapeptide-transferase [Candidatus Omnitrophica bacterium]|nr:phospho-N-acetylmuramoyl-pentapeptide-transferase [Candidatus Omnitrophota bacterium]MBU1809933.1 phospho-N-acetylmuramoyl-pentapeptide-transferase [Candidatus Omnitrophota bacterium]